MCLQDDLIFFLGQTLTTFTIEMQVTSEKEVAVVYPVI